MIKWKQFTCKCGQERCRFSDETIQRTIKDYQVRQEAEQEEHDDTEPAGVEQVTPVT